MEATKPQGVPGAALWPCPPLVLCLCPGFSGTLVQSPSASQSELPPSLPSSLGMEGPRSYSTTVSASAEAPVRPAFSGCHRVNRWRWRLFLNLSLVCARRPGLSDAQEQHSSTGPLLPPGASPLHPPPPTRILRGHTHSRAKFLSRVTLTLFSPPVIS